MFALGKDDGWESLKHKQGRLLQNIKGKLCGDKGNIGQTLFNNLFIKGVCLVTKVKNNRRNSLTSIVNRILFRE